MRGVVSGNRGRRVTRCGLCTWLYEIVQEVCSYPEFHTEENRLYKPQGTPLCFLVQNVYPRGLQECLQPGEKIYPSTERL